VELYYRLGPKAMMHIKPDLRDWLRKHGADPMTQPEFARFEVSQHESAAIIINSTDNKTEVHNARLP
jgi:hypothetical protein